MSFIGLLNQTATLRRLTNTRDRYNNIENDFDDEMLNIKIRLDYKTAIENEEVTNSDVISAKIFTQYTDINAHDEFVVNGETWVIVGEPITKQNATNFHHYEINVEKRIV
jgi:hypothetical protein